MLSGGIYTALVTPFTAQDTIDIEALKALISLQETSGIAGLVLAGTTAEAITFSQEEFCTVLDIGTKSTLPCIAGIGSATTANAIRLAHIAEQYPIEAFLVVCPYYNKPTQEGLFTHFEAIAHATEIPLILYNVPSRTGCSILPETVARLHNALPHKIIGIKEATADMLTFTKLRMLCGKNFLILSGDDATLYPSLTVGGNGAISVTSNIIPKVIHELFVAYSMKDYEHAQNIHEHLQALHSILFVETNPIPIKKALSLMGYIENYLRLPLMPLSEQYNMDLETTLRKYI